MPNWCRNELIVYGSTDEIKRFMDFVTTENSKLDFNEIVPQPLTVLDSIENNQGSSPLWYSWRVENWGTKWPLVNDDVYISRSIPVKDGEESVTYVFDTAWAPPKPIIQALGRIFKELSFHLMFDEPGCGFQGELLIEKGEVLSDYVRDYEEDDNPDDTKVSGRNPSSWAYGMPHRAKVQTSCSM